MATTVQRWTSLVRATLPIYWLAIFIGTHIPRVPPIPGLHPSDKVLHFLAFMGLAILMAATRATQTALNWRHYSTMFIVAAAYAAIDEWLQIPVGRDCSLADWYADIVGTFCGLAVFALMMKLFHRRKAVREELASERSTERA